MFRPAGLLAALLVVVAPLALGAPASAQANDPRIPGGPTPDQVKATVDEVRAAERSSKVDERVAVIGRAGSVEDPDVVRALEDGLYDKDAGVQLATIAAFSRMQTPEALVALHGLARTRRMVRDGLPLAALYRAIGRHGDRSSVEVLLAGVPGVTDPEVVRARIYALGNIRAREAVQALVSDLDLGTPPAGQELPLMEDVRVALARLTGTDQSADRKHWQDWWDRAKGDFQISPVPPALPPELQGKWDAFWGSDLAGMRPKSDVDLPTGRKDGEGAPGGKPPGTGDMHPPGPVSPSA
ncbi:MAG TPA: HEAT repeat domain-containing protein [Planctomycetota bacterium]|nr:HEAT repeat domain-containing protein [Planctomycetota bacterium]